MDLVSGVENPMEEAGTRRRQWVLTQEALKQFLAYLDPDPDVAGEKYEEIRRKLASGESPRIFLRQRLDRGPNMRGTALGPPGSGPTVCAVYQLPPSDFPRPRLNPFRYEKERRDQSFRT